MKKLLMLLFFFYTLSISSNIVASDFKDSDSVNIPIDKGGEETKEKNPRDLSFSPIMCLYTYGTFTFSFYDYFKDVSIVIVNTTTGELWSHMMGNPESIISIHTSADNGIYNICIYADDDTFYGYFDLTK